MPKKLNKEDLDPRKVEIGKRIDLIRETEGMSKEDLAKLLITTGQHIGRAISGEVGLSVEKIIDLSDETGFSTDFILKGTTSSIDEETKNLIKLAVQQSEKTYKTLEKIAIMTK